MMSGFDLESLGKELFGEEILVEEKILYVDYISKRRQITNKIPITFIKGNCFLGQGKENGHNISIRGGLDVPSGTIKFLQVPESPRFDSIYWEAVRQKRGNKYDGRFEYIPLEALQASFPKRNQEEIYDAIIYSLSNLNSNGSMIDGLAKCLLSKLKTKSLDRLPHGEGIIILKNKEN